MQDKTHAVVMPEPRVIVRLSEPEPESVCRRIELFIGECTPAQVLLVQLMTPPFSICEIAQREQQGHLVPRRRGLVLVKSALLSPSLPKCL